MLLTQQYSTEPALAYAWKHGQKNKANGTKHEQVVINKFYRNYSPKEAPFLALRHSELAETRKTDQH